MQDPSTKLYSYDVQYDDHGTFVTQHARQYLASRYQSVPIPNGAHGVMSGTGSVHVTGATQVT